MKGTTIRCKICDFSEGGDSLFHNSTTDGYAQRKWIIEEDGPVCEHCVEGWVDDKATDGEVPHLVEDDWPEDWGKTPIKKGWF